MDQVYDPGEVRHGVEQVDVVDVPDRHADEIWRGVSDGAFEIPECGPPDARIEQGDLMAGSLCGRCHVAQADGRRDKDVVAQVGVDEQNPHGLLARPRRSATAAGWQPPPTGAPARNAGAIGPPTGGASVSRALQGRTGIVCR